MRRNARPHFTLVSHSRAHQSKHMQQDDVAVRVGRVELFEGPQRAPFVGRDLEHVEQARVPRKLAKAWRCCAVSGDGGRRVRGPCAAGVLHLIPEQIAGGHVEQAREALGHLNARGLHAPLDLGNVALRELRHVGQPLLCESGGLPGGTQTRTNHHGRPPWWMITGQNITVSPDNHSGESPVPTWSTTAMKEASTYSAPGSIGHRIRTRRVELGLTQQQVATACGCHQGLVSQYESNQRTPSVRMLRGLSRALDLSLADLVEDTDAPERAAA